MADKKYSIVLAGVDRLSMMFTDAAKESVRLTGELREQEKAMRQLDNQSRSMAGYERQRAALSDMGGELAKAKEKVKLLSAEIAAAGEPTRAQAKAMNAAQKDVDQLSAAHEKQRGKLRASVDAMKESGVDVSRLASEQRRLRRDTDASSDAMEKQRKKLKDLAVAQSRLDAADRNIASLKGDAVEAGAAAAALALPVARAVARESSMADIAKVVDFESEQDKAGFQSELARQAVEANMTFSESADIAAAAGQSGIARTELLDFTQSATKMAVAFDMVAGEAGETMAAWRAAMGLGQDQVERLADAVNHVSNNMNARASDLSGVLKRQGAVALASGLTPEQAAGLGGALLSSGASEETSATAMKNMLGALTRGSAATSSQREAMDSLGFDAETLASDMQSDAVRTITDVFKAIADAPVEEQSALVSQLFGEESKGGIMPLLKNLKQLENAFGLTARQSEYAGAVNREYAARINTAGHTFGRFKQSLDRLLAVVGGSLLPVLEPVARLLGDGAMALADFAEQNEILTAAVSMGAAAYVAWKVAKLGYMYVAAKVEQVQARQQLSQAKLAAAEGNTATMANRAAAALARLNAVLAGTAAAGRGRAVGGSLDLPGGDIDGKDKDKEKGKGKGKAGGGRFMRAGGLVGGAVVAGATLLPMLMGGDDEEGMSGREIGGAAGGIAGGIGGWAAGAAAGAALGSVVPVIGTVAGGLIGAVLGGLAGGELGDWLGGSIGGWFDDRADADAPAGAADRAYADAATSASASPVDASGLSAGPPVAQGFVAPAMGAAALSAAGGVPMLVVQSVGALFSGLLRGSQQSSAGSSGQLPDGLAVPPVESHGASAEGSVAQGLAAPAMGATALSAAGGFPMLVVQSVGALFSGLLGGSQQGSAGSSGQLPDGLAVPSVASLGAPAGVSAAPVAQGLVAPVMGAAAAPVAQSDRSVVPGLMAAGLSAAGGLPLMVVQSVGALFSGLFGGSQQGSAGSAGQSPGGPAIGGLMGAIVSSVGSSLPDGLKGLWGDKLPKTDGYPQQPVAKNITYSPTIQISQLPQTVSVDEVVQKVLERQRQEIIPLLSGSGVRLDNSLEVEFV